MHLQFGETPRLSGDIDCLTRVFRLLRRLHVLDYQPVVARILFVVQNFNLNFCNIFNEILISNVTLSVSLCSR